MIAKFINTIQIRMSNWWTVVAGQDKDGQAQLLKVGPAGELLTGSGFSIPQHDYKLATYYDTGKTNLATIVFKTGGAGGTVVATLTITYVDGGTSANDTFLSAALTYP